MGAEGYNETIWVISDECALAKVSTLEMDICYVCRKKITTITCFGIDELHYCCNEIKSDEYGKRFCWDCARKLLMKKVVVSR